MTSHVFEKIVGNLRLRIFQDSDLRNPREEFDHVGTLVMFHNRYEFSDKPKNYKYPEELEEVLKEEGTVSLPVFMMDHSGLSVSVRDFGCKWDSGQIGYIYVGAKKIKQEGMTPEQAENCLRGEIEELNQYLTGDVYGFRIEKRVECDSCKHVEWEHVDSCWGFYGYKFCEEEALNILKGYEK